MVAPADIGVESELNTGTHHEWDLNSGPCCCEATVLTAEPPCDQRFQDVGLCLKNLKRTQDADVCVVYIP